MFTRINGIVVGGEKLDPAVYHNANAALRRVPLLCVDFLLFVETGRRVRLVTPEERLSADTTKCLNRQAVIRRRRTKRPRGIVRRYAWERTRREPTGIWVLTSSGKVQTKPAAIGGRERIIG